MDVGFNEDRLGVESGNGEEGEKELTLHWGREMHDAFP